jgi:hypothetical protein
MEEDNLYKINQSLKKPMITNIAKIALHFSVIRIDGILNPLLKSLQK